MMFNKRELDKDRVLKELDSLGYSDRMKKIALLGCKYKGDQNYNDLLSSMLHSGSSYEGQLALTGASVVKHTDTVLLALRHPKAGVRVRAVGLLPQVVTDSGFNIEEEIVAMSYQCRQKLLQSIVNVGREDWAERLLPSVYARWGGHEAALLLSACGEETIQRWLPQLGYALNKWKLLTKRYPDIVVDYFGTELQGASEREKSNIWWRLSAAIEILSVLRPKNVLAFAIKNGPSNMLHPVIKRQLGFLMKADSDGVFQLLAREESRKDFLTYGVPVGVLKKRKLFSMAQWTQLAILLADEPLHVAKILDTVAPSSRGAIFEAVYEKEGRKARIFPMQLLDVLPHQIRDKEAARILLLRDIRDHRDKRLEMTARRFIVHAREELQQAVQVSNVDERAAAYSNLILSTALSRTGMDETLRFLTRTKNDQDTVRGTVMTQLSSCPTSMYTEMQIPELTLLVDSVIEARDTSYITRAAMENLTFAILRAHAQEPSSLLFKFALRTFKRTAMRDGQFMLRSMKWDSIPDRELEILFDELYSLGIEANKREGYNFVLRMADTFGKAVERLPKLQLLLEELVEAKTVAPQAIRYWLAPRKTRDERVKKLLSKDPSFITFYNVFMHLHLKRQEWLDPFISGDVIKGKHLSGKTKYVLPVQDGFHRWLPRQQQKFATLLEKIALDAKRSFYERSSAIRSLAKMPDYNSNKFEKLLHDEEVHVVESVLHAYSLLEEPERALPVLLDNLDGDRARVAMYAIPRCARKINPKLLSSMLSDLLGQDKLKITVRKEAIRLLGVFKSRESMTLLMTEYEKPNVHKDVVIAIGHAARQWLEDERSWEILNTMASSPQRDIARSLLHQNPNELPLHVRLQYFHLIEQIATHEDATLSKEAYQAMSWWVNGNENLVAESASRGILNFDDNSRWKAAMNTLIVACSEGKINKQFASVCQQLLSVEMKKEWNANVERDVPHRQRLLALIDSLIGLSLNSNTRRLLIPLYEDIIDCLKSDATMKPTVIKLYLAMIDWNEVEDAIAHIEAIIEILTLSPYFLNYTYSQIGLVVNNNKGYWRAETLLAIVDKLKAKPQFESQYIGLSLLKVAGTALLWNEVCAERLRAYRSHEHEAIALLAMNMWTAVE